MNTFLPYPEFHRSAMCLDRQRLGKQRVEVYQLLRCLNGETQGWKNHPCTKMWKYNIDALVAYGVAICEEWVARGYIDTTFHKILTYRTIKEYPEQTTVQMPSWLGQESFHSSHRGNLLRKDPIWYGKFGWLDSPFLYYVWPVAVPQPLDQKPKS